MIDVEAFESLRIGLATMPSEFPVVESAPKAQRDIHEGLARAKMMARLSIKQGEGNV